MKTAVYVISAIMLIIGVTALAGEKAVEPKGDHASFDGTLVCLGCDLKKAEGARAACSAYGHNHVLKTKDGKYISFLENDFSKDLIEGKKYDNKNIKVTGIFHKNANMLDVETFTVDDKKMGWCSHCSAMDNCPFKKGKM